MMRVARWDFVELEVEPDQTVASERDARPDQLPPVEAWFAHGDRRVYATGFGDPDEPSRRRIRFMPDREGIWQYTVRVGEHERTGRLRCTAAEPGVRGPVAVAHGTRFGYADGTRFLPFGVGRAPEEIDTVPDGPFSKVRLTADVRRPTELEAAVHALRARGIEAELGLLLGEHDGWERDLVELVARLGAYRNVWWSVPAEHPASRRAVELIREYDGGGHLLSLHGPPDLDAGAPWLTHLSVRTQNVRAVSRLVAQYRKPVIVDDCGATGDGPELRDALPAEELLTRFAEGVCRGGFVTWRGSVDAETAGSISLLRDLLSDAPADPVYHAGDYDAATLRSPGSFVFQHHGKHRFSERTFSLPDGEHRIEVIDLLNRQVRPLPGRYTGEVAVPLQARCYQAVRITRCSPWTLSDRTGTRTVSIDVQPGAMPTVALWRSGEGSAYLQAGLDELVSCSMGKPWRTGCPVPIEPRIRREDDGLVIAARVGELELRLRLSFEAERLVLDATAYAASDQPCRDVVLGLRFPLPGVDPVGITMPGLAYRGNRGSEESVAVPRPSSGVVLERHRFPIPCVSAEWVDSERPGPAEHPDRPEHRDRPEQPERPRQLTVFGMSEEASIGVLPGQPTTLALLSGAVMFDGVPDVAYVHKGKYEPATFGYHTVTADRPLRLRSELDWGGTVIGDGDLAVLSAARKVFPGPRAARPLDLDRIIELKTNALDARWTEEAGAAGYLKFPVGAPHFLYGWTGQCLRLAWCDARLGSSLGEPERVERCRRAVDFYVQRSGTDVPGLRFPLYWSRDERWSGFERPAGEVISARAYGETVCDLIDVIELWSAAGWSVPQRWRDAVTDAVGFFAESARSGRQGGLGRPVPFGWRTDGSPVEPGVAAGLPCVQAVARAGEAEAAAAMFHVYQDVAWARSTLDAACEDKESGIAYLRAALALADATGEQHYLDLARRAADWLLTWVYVWNPGYPEGSRFGREAFSSIGWSTVSVQNHHLDVFFPYWEMARLGYTEAAFAMLGAVGQGICRTPGDWGFETVGEQAEGFFQTNWQRRGEANTWNPSWVISQVLSNALRLKEDEP